MDATKKELVRMLQNSQADYDWLWDKYLNQEALIEELKEEIAELKNTYNS